MIRETLQERLDQLTSAAEPRFGIMTPQHMLEHLILTIKLSSGRIPMTDLFPMKNSWRKSKPYSIRTYPFLKESKCQGFPIP